MVREKKGGGGGRADKQHTQIDDVGASIEHAFDGREEVPLVHEPQCHGVLHVVAVLLDLVVGERVLPVAVGVVAEAAFIHVVSERRANGLGVATHFHARSLVALQRLAPRHTLEISRPSWYSRVAVRGDGGCGVEFFLVARPDGSHGCKGAGPRARRRRSHEVKIRS